MGNSWRIEHSQRLWLVVILLMAGGLARAEAVKWSYWGGGTWETADKWSTGTVPKATDDASIDMLTTCTVDYNTDVYGASGAMKSLLLREQTVGQRVTLNINADHFRVSGTLTMSGTSVNVNEHGTLWAQMCNIQANSVLSLAPGGSAMFWGTAGGILVGNDNAGSLIMDGGTFISKGQEANNRGITVGAAYGGDNARPGGIVTIRGGSVVNDGRLMIGAYVRATDSTARQAFGVTSISDGSWSNGGNVVLGLSNFASASLKLSNVKGTLNVGGGVFTITNAAKKLYVGASGATGILNISNVGSLGTAVTPIPEILIGTTFDYAANTTGGVNGTSIATVGTGTLNLSGGAIYTNKLTAVNGVKSTVNISGGTLHTAGTVVNTGTVLAIGNGVNAAGLNLLGGNHSFANGLNIKANARLSGNGAISGAATIDGQLAIGGSTGTVSFNDGLVLGSGSSSTFEFTDPTFAAGSYDLATSNGGDSVSFGGTLALNFSGTFANDTSVKIFNFASYSGAFSAVTFSGLAAVQAATFDATTGIVRVVATPSIPEPAGAGLLLLTGTLALWRRR